MDDGKARPPIRCFRKVMDGGTVVHGFLRDGVVYINEDLAVGACVELRQTVLEEVAHYLIGSKDCTRDLQDWAFKLAVQGGDGRHRFPGRAVPIGRHDMAEDHSLPGWPKKKLVKEVRRHLSHYGIRPVRSELWRATWAWAEAIARSYWHTHWPLPSEIGTQYILLLLIEMKAEPHAAAAVPCGTRRFPRKLRPCCPKPKPTAFSPLPGHQKSVNGGEHG